jgi:hypothetical protein
VYVSNIRGMLDLRDLQTNLLMDLSSAVPKPQKPVLEGLQLIGKDTEQGKRLIKQVPRDKREQITVQSVAMQYHPSIASALGMPAQPGSGAQPDDPYGGGGPREQPPSGRSEGGFGRNPDSGYIDPGSFEGGGGGQPPPEQPPTDGTTEGGDPSAAGGADAAALANVRGFVITITGTSPHENALEDLVQNKLIKNLIQIKPSKDAPNRTYKVLRADLVQGIQLNQDPNRLQKIELDYKTAQASRDAQSRAAGGAGQPGAGPQQGPREQPQGPDAGLGAGPAAPGAPAGEGEEVPPAFQDRLTGEDIRNDWEFTLRVVVAIDPPPEPEQPAPAGDAAQPAASAQ